MKNEILSEVQAMMDRDIHQNLLNEITTFGLLSFLIISLMFLVYKTGTFKTKQARIVTISYLIIISLVTISLSSYTVYVNHNKYKDKIEDLKKDSKYSNGRYKIASSYPYWNYDLEKKLDVYLKSLPYKKTKSYTDFHFNENGEAEFYFNGKLEVKKIPELYKINPDKKPLLIYKEIDSDIYGIYKKGDIADVQFITNY